MNWKLSFAVVCAAASVCSAYDKRMVYVVEQLRELREVGSDAIGYAGIPHDFYSLYRYSWYASTDQDLLEMVSDPVPAVRIMGAKCILSSPFRKIDSSVLKPLLSDSSGIMVGPGGCVFTEMTVGEVVRRLKDDPNFLGPKEPRSAEHKSVARAPRVSKPIPTDAVFFDSRKIEAPLEKRRQWVIEQKERNRSRFEDDYSWILKAPSIGMREAQQIAYLFFYSAEFSCGFIDRPIIEGRVWRCKLHVGYPPGDAPAILVDRDTGVVWQAGQTVKIDSFSLIKSEKEKSERLNKPTELTPRDVTPAPDATTAPKQ